MGDGDAGALVPGWDLATFGAALRTTGAARVDFMISVGDDPGIQPRGDWLSESEVRALGKRDGRYLAFKARLVSPDGMASASLGRVTVQGTNGRAAWLVAGRPSRTLAQPAGLVFQRGVLTLQPTLVPGAVALAVAQDDFEDGVLDDVLWTNRTCNSVDLVERQGALRFLATTRTDGAASDVLLNLVLRGDFQIQLDHDTKLWPTSGGARAHSADVILKTDTGVCRLRRGAASNGLKARLTDIDYSIMGSVADAGGQAVVRLVRAGGDVTVSMGGDVTGGSVEVLGVCPLGAGDAILKFAVSPGYSIGSAQPIEVTVDDFEIEQVDGIVGHDRTGPQVQFETEDALLPRVEISPGSFALVGPVSVSLAATATIRALFYTTDGTDPASSSTRLEYEAPFALDRSARVRAVALTPEGQIGWPSAEQYFVGQALAHAPLDGDGGAVIETVHGWDGVDHETLRGVAGKQGRAAQFDGATSYVAFEDSTAFSSAAYQVASGAVSLWFKPTHVYGDSGLVSKDSMSLDTGGHLDVALADGEITVRLQSLHDSHNVDTRGADLQANRWHRVAVLFGHPSLTIMLWDDQGGFLGSWSEEYYGGLAERLGQAGNQEPFALGMGLFVNSDGVITTPASMFSGTIDEFFFLSLE